MVAGGAVLGVEVVGGLDPRLRMVEEGRFKGFLGVVDRLDLDGVVDGGGG